MLGDFITRSLVMVLGYAYPAFECYKTVEKNKVEIEELRFWCQYWILVAMLAVFERVGDIFISWLPMYGELKLGLYIYLWYPKTKGTAYVYKTLLRPLIAKHETDIDRKILELKARAWDFFLYNWQNCTQSGQTTLLKIFQYVILQSAKFTNPNANQKADEQNFNGQSGPAAATETPNGLSFLKLEKQTSQNKRWPPPSAPPTPERKSAVYRSMTESPKANTVQVNHETIPEKDNAVPSSPLSDTLNQARHRLRRSKQL